MALARMLLASALALSGNVAKKLAYTLLYWHVYLPWTPGAPQLEIRLTRSSVEIRLTRFTGPPFFGFFRARRTPLWLFSGLYAIYWFFLGLVRYVQVFGISGDRRGHSWVGSVGDRARRNAARLRLCYLQGV